MNRKVVIAFIVIVVLVLCVVASFFIVREVKKQNKEKARLESLKPLDSKSKKLIEVDVKDGMDGMTVGKLLEEKKIIKSSAAFYNYILTMPSDVIKVGYYYLSPANDVPYIFDELVTGGKKGFAKYKKKFISKHISYAKKLYQEYGVLPSINLAQMILESNWGRSKLSKKANNYYGIKARDGQEYVTMKTKEYVNGKMVTERAMFAKYKSWKEGMEEHSKLLANGTALKPNIFDGVIAAKNYKEAAEELQRSGYATDPDYAKTIVSVIEKSDLKKYDE